MISTATAFALGLDRNHNGSLEDEALDHIEVGGVGGTVDVPLLAVDRASITTDQGPDMVWTDLLVGVLDISVPDGPQIAGIFGMDYLTSGWAAKVLPALAGLAGCRGGRLLPAHQLRFPRRRQLQREHHLRRDPRAGT